MHDAEDTIFAVAAGGAGAALTIMRLSGGQAGPLLDAMCNGRPPARHASLRALHDQHGEVLDRCIVLWLPGPGSYTGEDGAELHLHGGQAVLTGVARALVAAGARPAEPGEFTRRAFLNGRLDLTEAEAVGDLVAAETDSQRRQALRQLKGELGSLYRQWTHRLVQVLARYEALIEFADEPGVIGCDSNVRELSELRHEITSHLDDGHRGERVRDGLVFALVGLPNVGKSSLLNALAARDIAIVSEWAGTTRDVIEARLDLNGIAVTLLDTAGMRTTDNPIEAEGVRRAQARALDADLIVEIRDGPLHTTMVGSAANAKRILVYNKCDLRSLRPEAGFCVSARTGEGVDQLRGLLAAEALERTSKGAGAPLTRARHRAGLQIASERLGAAIAERLPELVAEDVRLALRALGRITGAVGVEDVLDSVFKQFCIGK